MAPKLTAAERLQLAREKNPLPAARAEREEKPAAGCAEPTLQLTGPKATASASSAAPLQLTGPVTDVYSQLTALSLVPLAHRLAARAPRVGSLTQPFCCGRRGAARSKKPRPGRAPCVRQSACVSLARRIRWIARLPSRQGQRTLRPTRWCRRREGWCSFQRLRASEYWAFAWSNYRACPSGSISDGRTRGPQVRVAAPSGRREHSTWS